MTDAVTLNRRQLLALTPLPLVAAIPSFATLPAHAAEPPGGGQVIAFITDVHVNPEDQVKTSRARACADALVELDPDLVIHSGDLTDHGSALALRTWMEMFPPAFRERIHHVPGNHETHWNNDAYEAFEAEIGPLQYSVDLGDIHIVLNNSSIPAHGVADYDDQQIAWLRRDLAQAAGRPILAVGHHVLALTPNQIRNADKVLDVLTEAGAHAYLCGHIHSERNNVVNGLTELTGVSNGNEPGYYLLTRKTTEDSDVLEVERVDIADPTDPEVEPGRHPLPAIDLAPTDRNRLQPTRAEARITADGLKVDVELRDDVQVEKVEAAVMGPKLASGTVDNFEPLTADGNTWSVTLDLTEVPPGQNRAFIRVTAPGGTSPVGGNLWHSTLHFELEGFIPDWTFRLRGSTTAALISDDDRVITATTAGHVWAMRSEGRRVRPVWRAHIGPVHTDPVALADRGQIFYPSSDHRIYALNSTTGELLWQSDLGAPVTSDLDVATIDGDQVILAVAVNALYCLNADDGSIRWRQQLTGISGGPATCDGEQIYLGVGDGTTQAFDARTGEPRWSIEHADGAVDDYAKLTDGPWEARRLLLPDSALLAYSKDSMRAVRRSNGQLLWEREGSFSVCPAARMWGGQILSVSNNGTVRLLDPTTGDADLEVETVPYIKNADYLIRDSTVIITSVGGLVATVDLESGASEVLGQMAPDYVMSTPVLSPDESHYIVATMNGDLRSYPLPGRNGR
ncbi:PQQ-binding-like beta-propeller repeat protein [Ruania zhangjianzhongii]|uniref:outer membrane protein assembly factor BamB family protein n=1 Tax=Ruania zhangjianzhongii TaxID=2603206 RepID=UPI00143D4FA9|nr:PQQ-binding-like beta-propeller repeat protein [Ruania zhangjianzhongii]